MAFARASIVRGALRTLRTARPTVARPQPWRQLARRGYASGGHESAKAGSDLPWALGAVAVTVPSCWFLLSGSEDAHGHDDHNDHHAKKHDEEEESEEEESKDDGEAEAQDEQKEDDKESEKSDDSESDDESKDAETPETSDDEGDEKDESKDDSKTTSKGAPKLEGERKSIPDPKGGNKKRIESPNAIKQGKEEDVADSDNADKAAASKTAGGPNSQSGKQEGLTNTDTKHSTDIANDPTKSKKGEGTPETAKSKGTVDVNRPQGVEQYADGSQPEK